MVRGYIETFNEKIGSFKGHESYAWLRKYADAALQNHTGVGVEAIRSTDFMDRIVAMPEEYILDWLNGKNNLEWRKQDKLLLAAQRGGYEELQARFPEVEIHKIQPGALEFYKSLGFELLQEKKECCLVAKSEEINSFKQKQHEELDGVLRDAQERSKNTEESCSRRSVFEKEQR